MQKNMQKKRSLATKSEIFKFIEYELGVLVTAIEELGNGVVYCRLFEKLYPGSIKKIKMNAKQEYESLGNLKLLQSAFEKQKVQKTIEIQKLSKQKFLDNLNFMQWYMQFYQDRAQNRAGNDVHALSPEPQKKVKVNNPQEEDIVSFGSIFKASEFKIQPQETFLFVTTQKEKRDQFIDMSASMLVSPMIGKENAAEEDNYQLLSKLSDLKQLNHELQESNL